MKRNNEIQTLRAISMLFVLLGHTPIVVPNVLIHGYTFVSLFLAICGYFAAVQFQKKYDGKNVRPLMIVRREVTNKFYRLFPLMWIWIALYFLIGNTSIALGGQYGDINRWLAELKAATLLNYNYYLASLSIGGLFGQYWTLFVELHFFALFVLVFIILKKKNHRIIFSALMVLLTVFVFRPMTQLTLIRYVTHAHFDSLFCGVLIGLCCEDKKYLEKFNTHPVCKKVIGIFLIAALLLVGYVFDNYYPNPSIKYVVYTVLATAILFLARENDGWFTYGKPIDAVFKWCGDASASTYVSHVILYSCLYYNIYYNTNLIPQVIKDTPWGTAVQLIFMVVVACLVGRLSYRVIEVPFGRIARERLNRLESAAVSTSSK